MLPMLNVTRTSMVGPEDPDTARFPLYVPAGMFVGSAVMVRVAGVPPLIPLAPFTFSQDAFERITNGEPLELVIVSCWLCTGPPTWAEKDSDVLSTATVCAFSAPAAHKIRIK